MRHRRLCILLLMSVLGASAGCNNKSEHSNANDLVSVALAFRASIESGDYDTARRMMTHAPRRWFEEREGPGMQWNIGPKSGPWAEWDTHFRSESEELQWEAGPGTATLVLRETNDYFRLLERGWVTNEIIYYFDAAGRIDGLLIRATGDRPPGRTDEFLVWARTHDPDELSYLMPNGDVDPSADRPQRYRALLNRWRESAGLAPIQ